MESVETREPSLQIHLLLSIVKFDRFEWCLEKATELGVTEITPLASARTDKALIAAAGKRRSRWEKILLESAQQARRLRPPILHFADETATGKSARASIIIRPADALAQSAAACRVLLSEHSGAKPMRDVLSLYAEPWAALAIGPEGGWTDDELAAARTAAFTEVSLGENILRTETAAIASLAILRFTLGE
jgi:16S rRNA (uracil1498-N3)-methyltransferase